MAVPNKKQWLEVFAEVFKDLDARKLAPQAQILFNEEFLIHKMTCTSWFKCRNCKKTWHSFKGSMEFKYGLKKEGKPKKRMGKVTLIPYGQQCLVCQSKQQFTDDDDGDGRGCNNDVVYWMPYFDYETIEETLEKVHEKVERKFYLEKTPDSSTYVFYKSAQADVSNKDEDPQDRRRKRQDGAYYNGRAWQRQPRLKDDDDDESVAGLQPLPRPKDDDDDESIVGDITNGPHKDELCEACQKGKCSYGNHGNTSRGSTSGRESRQSDGSRVSKPPVNFDDIDDGSSLPNKVKWHLLFQSL